ncbi:hypothetical protein OCH239_17100 [Roseivivax halodurans JCM 10272]|uniref:Metal-dependent hydrolase n=1 Tax=Roseivivax halodurans JCM 10272 TaxID=1449350 RepID=X7EA01_9RHOB|nr:hypothetical protein [Roseivivax halodurans]ETX12782.1 hypothetical protein OCH239_17100 [Roseivivax halodurans JCM 10272]
MPNTLAHIGVQTLVTRGLMRGADIKWIWLGCIIPDLPWIGQRIVQAVRPDMSLVDLRLYAIAQSSLLLCVVLSAALALFSRARIRVFGILAGGSLLHLLLDAMQTKWGNGVVLGAPFDWTLLNFELFWPEHPLSLALTVLGCLVAAWTFLRAPPDTSDLCLPGGAGGMAAAALLTIWLLGPMLLIPGAERADLHHAATLRLGPTERAGRAIAFDRARVTGEGGQAQVWSGETLSLTGHRPEESGTISLRGQFTGSGAVVVSEHHTHISGLRDYASYVGLILVAALWVLAFALPQRRHSNSP